jgi:membrane protease YdiL (CAAX protease family)
VITAFLFACYHLNFHPIPFAVRFAFGLAFGSARLRGGSLWAPAVAHTIVWILLGAS